MMLLNVVLVLMVALAGVADVAAVDKEEEIKKCKSELEIAISGKEDVCAAFLVYVKCYIIALGLNYEDASPEVILYLEEIFSSYYPELWKRCHPDLVAIFKELHGRDGSHQRYKRNGRGHGRGNGGGHGHGRPQPDCKTKKPTPQPNTTLPFVSTTLLPTDCVSNSVVGCLGRADADYRTCDQLRCEEGFYVNCALGIFSERRCPTATYNLPSGPEQRYLVFDPITNMCVRSTPYCRRLLDQFADR